MKRYHGHGRMRAGHTRENSAIVRIPKQAKLNGHSASENRCASASLTESRRDENVERRRPALISTDPGTALIYSNGPLLTPSLTDLLLPPPKKSASLYDPQVHI